MSKIMRLWQNAIEITAGRRGGAARSDASKVLVAIRKEWDRRRVKGPRPDDFFNWPNTEAPTGMGKLSTEGWLQEGLLKYMGYQVGSTGGRSTPVRRRILEEIFEGSLPPVFEPQYMAKWGPPESPLRLQQMAETLASFARNSKRRLQPNMAGAIRDWEADLYFLYEQYYLDRFHFGWPSSDL
ncbi:hypothetical protein [Maritimibacter sp. DP1N21-5]|uniref:hypothetical protein n=1 Tax=Maritimibacter sp. DP1N21-5 TaxID=2836867 RepID=UPI001C449C37|nr:hypothetical protein [Maritimibacter sp. DP1N21-5]MBV7410866.1 hypothetical protein [Maritimibacter sp. DP1N21-5]